MGMFHRSMQGQKHQLRHTKEALDMKDKDMVILTILPFNYGNSYHITI
jgi:hypothetical protein